MCVKRKLKLYKNTIIFTHSRKYLLIYTLIEKIYRNLTFFREVNLTIKNLYEVIEKDVTVLKMDKY